MADDKSSEDFKRMYGNNEVIAGIDYGTKKGDMSVKITADVSDALKALKAVQREARKTTAALKELEEQQKKFSSLPTGDMKSKSSYDEMFDAIRRMHGDANE